MRVLIISKTYVASTYQRKLEELVQYPDLELTLITPSFWMGDEGRKQVFEHLHTNGYEVIITPMAFNGNFHFYYYPQLTQLIQATRPDIIHIDEEPYNMATIQAMRLAQKSHIPALFIAWQNINRRYPPPFRQIELYNYKHTTMAMAGTQAAADVLRQKGYQGPTRVVPQFGFDSTIYHRSTPRRPRQPGDPFTLGFIGRLKEEKGLALIIEALTFLPGYCRAVFVGEGPFKEALQAQAARLNLTDRVIFKPGIPPQLVPAEFEQLDVHVLPSLSRPNWIEQFGRTIAEAMLCETPVIGSNSGEIPYVIADAGLIFPEGNARALSDCVKQLLDDPTLYANLAQKGRQHILDNYTPTQIARQTYEAYCAMLKVQV